MSDLADVDIQGMIDRYETYLAEGDRIDAACKWAIQAYRNGDSRRFVANVLEITVEGIVR